MMQPFGRHPEMLDPAESEDAGTPDLSPYGMSRPLPPAPPAPLMGPMPESQPGMAADMMPPEADPREAMGQAIMAALMRRR